MAPVCSSARKVTLTLLDELPNVPVAALLLSALLVTPNGLLLLREAANGPAVMSPLTLMPSCLATVRWTSARSRPTPS